MPRYIVKHTVDGKDRYLEWSTVVDAPVTYGLSLDRLRRHWKEEYGRVQLESLERDIARGGAWCKTVADVVAGNRAGAGETRLTREQIVDYYFVRRGRGKRPLGSRS